MELWNSVCVTDKAQTQSAKVDGNKLTAINGQYVVMKATEVWGEIGIGWGYEIVSERLDDSGPIYDTKDPSIVLCMGKLHTIILKVWFMNGDQRSEPTTHYGHTKFIYKSSWGFTVDYEYAKKSLTDALKKCLSMYGFCADVYLGKFDNTDYIENSQHEIAIKNAENKAEMILTKKEELLSYVENSIKAFEMIPNIAALSLVAEKNANSIVSQCKAIDIDSTKLVDKIKKACNLRMEAIKTKEESKNDK